MAREALVVSVSPICDGDITPRVVLTLTICCHDDQYLIVEIVETVVKVFNDLNPHSRLINFASDGDPARRKAMNSLRIENTCLPALKDLKLFDQQLILGKMGFNLDPKHSPKRRLLAISDTKSITLIKKSINKVNFRLLLDNQSDSLFNPKDRQNVPSAVKLQTEIHLFQIKT